MQKNISKDLYRLSFSMKKELHRRIFIGIINFILIFISLNLVLSFVIYPVQEQSDSMGPDISKNSLVFVSPVKGTCDRGDVFLIDKNSPVENIYQKLLSSLISFFTFQKKSYFNETEDLSSRMVLRRIIGMPGDTVYMKNFMIYIKPQDEKHFLTEFELTKKSYNIEIKKLPQNWDDSVGLKAGFTPVILGPNQYFVMADNRYSSFDSRMWGIVDKSELVAKALVLYFPVKRFKFL
ncbi:MAG: signal peptidase I [Treponema sp.]|nr:signal peptidase I [Candidatus Treponema merdequi]